MTDIARPNPAVETQLRQRITADQADVPVITTAGFVPGALCPGTMNRLGHAEPVVLVALPRPVPPAGRSSRLPLRWPVRAFRSVPRHSRRSHTPGSAKKIRW